jgi:hypothetical protein
MIHAVGHIKGLKRIVLAFIIILVVFYATKHDSRRNSTKRTHSTTTYVKKGNKFEEQQARKWAREKYAALTPAAAATSTAKAESPDEIKDAFVAPCHDTDCYWRLAMEGPRALPEVG